MFYFSVSISTYDLFFHQLLRTYLASAVAVTFFFLLCMILIAVQCSVQALVVPLPNLLFNFFTLCKTGAPDHVHFNAPTFTPNHGPD